MPLFAPETEPILFFFFLTCFLSASASGHSDMGMLEPETSDGRVLFLLPWERGVIAGTTDSSTDVTYAPTVCLSTEQCGAVAARLCGALWGLCWKFFWWPAPPRSPSWVTLGLPCHAPQPTQEDINWVINEVQRKLSPDIVVRPEDIKASWAGIRPLVRCVCWTAAAATGAAPAFYLFMLVRGALNPAVLPFWPPQTPQLEEHKGHSADALCLYVKVGPHHHRWRQVDHLQADGGGHH